MLLKIRIIIYLDMLLRAKTLEEILIARDTIIYFTTKPEFSDK